MLETRGREHLGMGEEFELLVAGQASKATTAHSGFDPGPIGGWFFIVLSPRGVVAGEMQDVLQGIRWGGVICPAHSVGAPGIERPLVSLGCERVGGRARALEVEGLTKWVVPL